MTQTINPVLWDSTSARVVFRGSKGEPLYVGGSFFPVGGDDPHTSSNDKHSTSVPGPFRHRLVLYEYQSYDTGFRHEIESVVKRPESQKLKRVKIAVVFNVQNIKSSPGVRATYIHPTDLTGSFAASWEFTTAELTKLKAALKASPMSHLWAVRLAIDAHRPISSGLLASIDHFANNSIVKRFREAYEKTHYVEYLVVGAGTLKDQVARVMSRISTLRYIPPCARFWGGKLVPDELPSIKPLKSMDEGPPIQFLEEQQIFPTWDHFITVMAYGVAWKSDSSCGHQLIALRAMHDQVVHPGNSPQWLPIILGTNLFACPRLDLYQPLGTGAEALLLRTHQEHDKSQIAADAAVRDAPCGHTAISGFAGTGKSFWSYTLPQPYIMDRWKSKEHVSRSTQTFLYLTTSNAMVNVTFQALLKRSLKSVPEGVEPLIVRATSVDCQAECVALRDIILLAKTNPDGFDLTERFKQFEGTLGHWMLRFMGLDKFGRGDAYTDVQKYTVVARQYQADLAGETPSFKGPFRQAFFDLMRDVLRSADCIITTLQAAAKDEFWKAVVPFATIVDDAAGVTEPDLYGIYGFFSSCHHVILLGDERPRDPARERLPPESENRFGAQLRLPAYSRYVRNGVPCIDFDQVHRYDQDICDVIGPALYDSSMRSRSEKHDDSQRECLGRIVQKLVGKSITSQLFEITTQPTYDASWQPRDNVESAEIVSGFVMQLVQGGTKASEILVLSPCEAQKSRYASIFDQLDRVYPDVGLDKIQIESFLSSRGKEAGVVIMDTVISNTWGLLEDEVALIVAATRAQRGFFVFSNVEAILSLRDQRGLHLRRLLCRFRDAGYASILDQSLLQTVFRHYRDDEMDWEVNRELQGWY